MTKVIKKDGRKQEFQPKKVSKAIKKAVINAGLSLDSFQEQIDHVIEKITKMAEKTEEIDFSVLRTRVLSELDAVDKRISDAWRDFDSKYKEVV